MFFVGFLLLCFAVGSVLRLLRVDFVGFGRELGIVSVIVDLDFSCRIWLLRCWVGGECGFLIWVVWLF